MHTLYISEDKKYQLKLVNEIKKIDPTLIITPVSSIEELFIQFDTRHFDCLIIEKPADNYDSLDLALAILEKRKLPLVLFSAQIKEQEAIQAFQHGFNDYIIKNPFPRSVSVLVQRIKNIIEKDRIEKHAEHSEELINSYFDEANENFILLDENFTYITVNTHYAQANNLKREEIVGKHLFDIAPGVAESNRPEIYRRVLETGEPIDLENVGIETQNGTVYVNIKAFKVGDGLGLITQDITDQNEIKKELERELEVSNSLSQLYPPLMDPSTTIEDISKLLIDNAKRLTNSPYGFVAVIEYGTGDQINYIMRQSLGEFTMDIPSDQIRLPRNPDGTYRALLGYSLNTRESFYTNDAVNHPASKGVPHGHVSITRFLSVPAILGDEIVGQIAVGNSESDYIDEDVKSLERLANMFALAVLRRNYEEQYRSVVENSLSGIAIEIGSNMVYVNPKYAEIFEYEQSELIGESFEKIVHPDDIERLKVQAEKRQKGLSQPRVYEFKGVKKDGSLIAIEALTTLIKYRGKPASLSFVIDISETNKVMKELEAERVKLQQARAMDELKNRFVSTATHELRTPVTAIKGYIELINDGVFGDIPEEMKQAIAVVDRNTTRLSKLTDDLLDLQRLESGRLNISPQVQSLRNIIDEVLEEMNPHFSSKKQVISKTYPHENIKVNVDKTRMSQVLYNLLSNASKFSPENSIITLYITQMDDHLLFKIQDQGIGISKQDLDKIFTPFPNISKREAISGTGLGLNITKSIIELHNGTIWVESEGEDKGTTFLFTLPLCTS